MGRAGAGRRPDRARARPSCASSRCRTIADDGALLKVEVAGICGTDVKMYAKPPFADPVIMGHENVGVIAEAGAEFLERQRLARATGSSSSTTSAASTASGAASASTATARPPTGAPTPTPAATATPPPRTPATCGAGSPQYMYLPWNAVLHKVPDGVTAELAGLVTPLSNGIEWALLAAGVGYSSTVLIQGPGQQGLSQVVACKQAGASQIIVTRHDARQGAARARAGRSAPTHVIDVLTGGRARAGHGASPAARASTSSSTARRGAGTAPGAARHRRAQAPRGHPADPGRAGGVPRLPGQEAHREGDHHQERPRAQLPGLRARARAARLGPLPAGAARAPTASASTTSTTPSGSSAARPTRTSSTSR